MLTKPDLGRSRVAELACGQKKSFDSLEQAEQWAVRHYDCSRCVDGARMGAYPCWVDPSHWHTGHMAVRP